MLRGIWGDPDRFVETYWAKFGDKYFAGDGAHLDADGDVWLLGRVDDVMNVSGHRLSTMEIESALVAHEMTAEAAVIGADDETTGQAVVAFVILKARHQADMSEAEAEAEVETPELPETVAGLTCERDGLFLVFTIAGTTYRIGGVKPLFVTSLRVNIRASNGGTSYYDSIDLYAARGRVSFAQAVNRAWGAEPVRIERDLVMILEHLEKERDEAMRVGAKRAVVT